MSDSAGAGMIGNLAQSTARSGNDDTRNVEKVTVVNTNTNTFDAMTRHAAAVSRRGSFRLFGGAALTGAFAAPAVAHARNAGKNGQKRCKRQRGHCLAAIETVCASSGAPQLCEALFSPCCEHFAHGNAGEGITCLFEAD